MSWKDFLAKKHDRDAIEKFNEEMFRERIREAILEIVNYDLIELEVAKKDIYAGIESNSSSFGLARDAQKAIRFRMFTDSKKADYWKALKQYFFKDDIKLKFGIDDKLHYRRGSDEFILTQSYFNEVVHQRLYEVFKFR